MTGEETQDRTFVKDEGDRWFRRNRESLSVIQPEEDLPLRLVDEFGLEPGTVLEIGAANGARLSAEAFPAEPDLSVAIDVSQEALVHGAETFDTPSPVRGAASSVPLQRSSVDLVILHFVLHWIDRDNLLDVVSEVDRVLVDGGHVLVGDFHPGTPRRVPYHHRDEEIWTYKRDHSEPFVASGRFRLVGLLTGHHADQTPSTNVDDEDRIATWLLERDEEGIHRQAGNATRGG